MNAYHPGSTFVHRLHPLVKLAWLLVLSIGVFLIVTTAAPLIVVAAAIVLLWVAGVAPWRIAGLRMWIVLSLIVVATQIAFVRGGDVLLGPITTAGLNAGVRAAGRLLAIVLLSTLFVRSTDPTLLACGLMRAGLPYRWGFALVTALRLVPVFQIEAHHVYRAQLVRGVAYDVRGPRRWWLVLRHLCLPMLVTALRTVQGLSLSMEGRAFGLHPRRTFLRDVTFTARDAIALALLVACVAIGTWLAAG